MLGKSTPFKYALTSGIPEPAAAGDRKTQRREAESTRTTLQPVYTSPAKRGLKRGTILIQ